MVKVIFLHLSVIHSVHRGGGGLPQCILGYHPPLAADTPPDQTTPHTPQTRSPSPDQEADIPPRTRPPQSRPPRPGSRLQHTVYERPVRILLECILVYEKVDCVTNLEEFFGSPAVGFHVVVDLSITHWGVCLMNPNFLDLKSSTRISVKVGGSINTVHIGDCIHLKRKRSD